MHTVGIQNITESIAVSVDRSLRFIGLILKHNS